MRVAIDIRVLARGSTTGIPGYTGELIRALRTYHPELELILLYTGVRKNPLPQEWLSDPGITLLSLAIPNRLLDLLFRIFKKPTIEWLCARKKIAPPDLIFSPHFNLLPPSATSRIITFHDLSFIRYPEFFSAQQHAWHRLQHYKTQAERATGLIAVSAFTKSDLTHLLGISAEKITVIPSGISEEMSPLKPEEAGKLLVYKEERKLHNPFILHIGSLEPRKNLELLICAFEEFKKDPAYTAYELVLAGRPGFRAGRTRSRARRSPYRHQIRFLDSVTDEERPLLYQAARSFVFPSFFEGFGFPPLEAQACGTPVIASNRSSLAEILGESALLINPWNASALARALHDVEKNTALRNGIINAGIANARAYTWKRAADSTCELFIRTAVARRPHANTQKSEPLHPR